MDGDVVIALLLAVGGGVHVFLIGKLARLE